MSRKRGIFERLDGQKFGRWTVLDYAGRRNAGRNTMWNCVCDCGGTGTVSGTSLKKGSSQSCGCLVKERTAAATIKHGHAVGGVLSPEYRSWQHMRRRCQNPKEPNYFRYGGRGITICARWESFENFFADVGPRPSKKHSLGRIDNDGNYEPGNVRWETPLEQGGNNSRNRLFTINGKTQCFAAWVRELGLVGNTVHRRLKRGMTIEQALELQP